MLDRDLSMREGSKHGLSETSFRKKADFDFVSRNLVFLWEKSWKTKSLEWTEDDSPARDLLYSRTGMEWTDGTPATCSFPYFGDVYCHYLRLKDLL